MRWVRKCFFLAATIVIMPSMAFTQEEETKAEAASTDQIDQSDQLDQTDKKDVKKHAVKAAKFKITFELDAVVDSPSYQVITIRTKSFSDLKLQEVAEHGQRVAKGQSLLRLDSAEWERAKRNAEQAVTSARLELEQAKKQAENIEETIQLELKAAELTEKVALFELDYFNQKGKQQQAEMWGQMLKVAEQYVEYTREEYEQLKKMYDADEITEETEEIVLRRAKNDLEQAEFYLKNTRQRVERLQNFELSRQETEIENAAASAKLNLEKLRQSIQVRMETTQLQVVRAETALEEANRKLTHLTEDQKVISSLAEFPGIVFHGLASRGKWKGSGNMENMLVPGEVVPTGQPLITVIGTDGLFVHAVLPERLLKAVSPGARAFLVLKSASGRRIELECDNVIMTPIEPDQYRADFHFVRPMEAKEFLPLMTGKIHGTSYEKENALTVPIKAVHYDHATPYVNILDEKTGQQRRQDVTVGQSDDEQIEIEQGLREGEYVVLP